MSMRRNQLFYDSMEPQSLADRYGRSYNSREGSQHFSNRHLPAILLRVPMCCNKCEEKVREELLDMEGVYGFTCDQQKQTVSVTGSVNPLQLLKKMKRIKRKSEFWDGSAYMNYGSRVSRAEGRGSNLDAHYVHREKPVYRLSHSQRPVFDEPFRSTSYESPYYVHREEPVYRLSHSQIPIFDEPFRSTSYETPYYVHREEPVYRLSHSQRPVFNEPFRSTSYETPYRNSYTDSPGTYSSRRYPSPPFRLPYSPTYENERVLPYAQTYYTEDYPSWRY